MVIVLLQGLVIGDTMQNVVGMLFLMNTQDRIHIFVNVFRGLNLWAGLAW